MVNNKLIELCVFSLNVKRKKKGMKIRIVTQTYLYKDGVYCLLELRK